MSRRMRLVAAAAAVFLSASSLVGISYASPAETRLHARILDDCEPLERPVKNVSRPVVVKMGLVLQQIIAINMRTQLADVNAWLKLSWHDEFISWDPADYGGVADVRLRPRQLWTPDILMYNSADPDFNSMYASQLLVYPSGEVNWIPPGIFKLTCTIDVVWFPFDVQRCYMKFGSWTYDGSKLDLQVDANGFDVSTYMPNGEWQLVDTHVQRSVQYYACCPEPYYDLVFSFTIRRRTIYYAFNLLMPTILITSVSLVGFTLPPDAGEKMSLQISILLSICVFQNYLAEISPPTSIALPFLGAFFTLCFFTCACSVIATAVVINMHTRTRYTHRMTPMQRLILVEWLGWMVGMSRPGFTARRGKLRRCKSTSPFGSMLSSSGYDDESSSSTSSYMSSSKSSFAFKRPGARGKRGDGCEKTRASEFIETLDDIGWPYHRVVFEDDVEDDDEDDEDDDDDDDFSSSNCSDTIPPTSFSLSSSLLRAEQRAALALRRSLERRPSTLAEVEEEDVEGDGDDENGSGGGDDAEKEKRKKKKEPEAAKEDSCARQAQVLLLHRVHDIFKSWRVERRVEMDDQEAESEWRWAAMAVDRTLMFILTFFATFGTLGLFLSVPNVRDTL